MLTIFLPAMSFQDASYPTDVSWRERITSLLVVYSPSPCCFMICKGSASYLVPYSDLKHLRGLRVIIFYLSLLPACCNITCLEGLGFPIRRVFSYLNVNIFFVALFSDLFSLYSALGVAKLFSAIWTEVFRYWNRLTDASPGFSQKIKWRRKYSQSSIFFAMYYILFIFILFPVGMI
jgi:hypothetical protein